MAKGASKFSNPLVAQFVSVVADPKNVGRLCELVGRMPNVKMKTLGGKVFWETLAESNGFKLQKNKFTDHCRILDAANERLAWGSEAEMRSLLNESA